MAWFLVETESAVWNPRSLCPVFTGMDQEPAMSEVDSSAISRIAYEPRRGTLSVWFRETGACYRYFGVPPAVHSAFAMAASKGRFLNLHIRDRYDFCRKAA